MIRTTSIFLFAAFLLFSASSWLAISGFRTTRHIANADVRHELGHAYILPFQAHWPFVVHEDSESDPDRSDLALYENDVQLGPAHSVHDLIRLDGHGHYSLWNGKLRFSSSDSSNPISNGRSYHAKFDIFLPPWFVAFAFAILLFALLLNRHVLSWFWRKLILVGRIPGTRWAVENVLPGVLISILFLVVAAGIGEAYFRAKEPFISSNWPIRFDPRFGWNFVPGSTLRLTNHTDFWAVNHANSLGFLDRQPPKLPYPKTGTCRVALIGDSFVEAAQVPIGKKIQVRLEEIANKNRNGPKLQTMAFGYSGTGQANQLPFYDVFARRLHPNLVVLVMVGNDFANNSSVLESIRNGWDPVHPPRLFYNKDAAGTISDVPIDPSWIGKAFPRRRVAVNWQTSLHRALIAHSYLYNWAFARAQLGYPRIARWIDGTPAWNRVYASREREVKKRWGNRFNLNGWHFPDDWNMDTMFFAQRLAPVFKNALAFTGHALDQYLERGKRDGFRLVILADKSMYLPTANQFKVKRPNLFARNPLSKTGQIDRLKALAQPRNIPVIDLYAYIKSIHENPRLASWAHNGHWSPLGHRWAAQALYRYIHAHPTSCSHSKEPSQMSSGRKD